MTAAEMLSLFDLLQDKVNDPYFTDSEKYEYLNDAQTDYVNQYLGLDDGGGKEKPPKLGINDIVESALRTIIEQVTLTTSTAGLLTDAAIKTAVASDDWILVMDMYTVAGDSVNYVERKNVPYILKMEFAAPTTDYPIYNISAAGIQLYPKETISDLDVWVLRDPLKIGAAQDCELPSFVHSKIVAMALQKTGYVTEDEAMTMIENVTSG